MRRVYATLLILAIMLCAGCASSPGRGSARVQITNLRCEYLSDPLGIDVAQPRLSWVLQSRQRGQMQKA
jgi:alpha-L-rhamnosidase